jgi:hypothetical protein
LVALLATLRDEPAFELFNGRMQVVGQMAIRVEHSNLAGWLLRRAKVVGPEQAIADVHRYIEADDILFVYTLAVAGIKLPRACSLAPDLELMPWDTLPESSQKHYIFQQFMGGFGFHWPTVAMLRRLTFPKVHVQDADLSIWRSSLPREEVQDALLCIGLIGPTAPYVVASWLAPPDWAPILSGGYELPHLEGLPRKIDWPGDACDQARAIFQSFANLEDSRKARLRLAMQWLNRAMRRPSPVDAAIDLGIALEALFLRDLSDDRGELTFRLKLRAARYLGSDPEDRRRVFRLTGNLYTMRSIAVHTGQVPDRIGDLSTIELLDQGFVLVASTIDRFISQGEPDWDSVTFS